jgi:uncharacterized protein (UPF0261 family)
LKKIIILGTLDTKGKQIMYLKEIIEARGQKTIVIDLSMGNVASFKGDFTPCDILALSEKGIEEFRNSEGLSELKKLMAARVGDKVMDLLSKDEVDGIVTIGGITMAILASQIMQRLPYGIPKVIGTTAAMPAYVKEFFDATDITVMQLLVEVGSVNELVNHAIEQVAGAISGMVDESRHYTSLQVPQNSVSITELNFSQKCARLVETLLEEKGYQVFSFHAQGISDRVMDKMISQGFFSGVIDIVPAGLAEEFFGGTRAAGMERLDAAIERGIPLVLSPCCLNLTGAGPASKNNEKYASRPSHKVDQFRSYVRFNIEELRMIARLYSEKLNRANGPVKLIYPTKGWSGIDREGSVLYNPKEDRLFLDVLKKLLKVEIDIEEVDCNLEDPEFAVRLVDSFDDMFKGIQQR